MPLIQCHVAKGMSPERKRGLMSDLVEVTSQTLNADPRTITLIIHEHEADNIRTLEFVARGSGASGSKPEDG